MYTTGASALLTARRVIAGLSFSRRIGNETLRRPNDRRLARGLWDWPVGQQRTSCSSRTSGNDVVRAFDLRADRLDARDVYRAESGEYVSGVAYSAESDTLFVATWNYEITRRYRCQRALIRPHKQYLGSPPPNAIRAERISIA